MSDIIERLEKARTFLLERCPNLPSVAITLGSGLGDVSKDVEVECDIPFESVPGFKGVSVVGHGGRILIGSLYGIRTVCMLGRLHYYEGHTMDEVVFPVRALAYSGVENFLLTNASGGLHKHMRPLDFLLIRDHINMFGTNPLVGPNEPKLGPRFPDMTYPYDRELGNVFLEVAQAEGLSIHEGVYVGLHGPTYETPAENNAFRGMGGDAVGMSTVPEVIALRHMGKRVVGLSCITNLAAGVTGETLDHSEVLDNAKKIYLNFSRLLKGAYGKLRGNDEFSGRKNG